MRTIGTPSTQARKLNAIASGALPNGDPVVVNADGTVSVVAGASVNQALGSASVFLSATIADTPSAAFDSNSNRVVIAYQGPNPYSGFVVVGTISGTSVSFGTPVQYKTQAGNQSIAFDSSNNKIVIAYRFGGDLKGYAIVGTVSGTSISFGTPVEFEAGNMAGSTSAFVNSNKVVISYRDGGNSYYGTSIVGTVSGTSISFGTAVVFESASISTGASDRPSSANITGTDKVVIAYKDVGNSNRGTAIVGTVSGTSISFGSATVFDTYPAVSFMSVAFSGIDEKIVLAYQDNSTNYGAALVGTVSGSTISFGSKVVFESAQSDNICAALDSNAGKVVIAYRDAGNSSHGTLVVGIVSGTTISFETPVVFEAASIEQCAITFDNVTNKIVLAYKDSGNSSYGTSVVFQNASTSTNLTSENYIGLASNGYPDTAGATIDVQGAINDRQSGLTAGQSYYVQTDGTLTTTAGDPSVFAGTAISATKMIVKG